MFGFKKRNTAAGKNIVRLEIPTFQVLKLIAILVLIFLVFKLQHVIILLFLSFILMAATKPAVFALNQRFKLPKPVAVVLVYICILLTFGFVVYFISIPLSSEVENLSKNAPEIISNLSQRFPFIGDRFNGNSTGEIFRNFFGSLSKEFSNFGNTFSNALSFTFGAFSVLLQFISMVIISIYMLLERNKIINFFIVVFKFDKDEFYRIYDRVENQLGAWVRGQFLLGIIVGLLTYIGLSILGVKYALPLAVLAGILEIIPIIGPIISAIPIILVGFSASPITGILAIGVTILVQQLENHLLVPGIMKRAVGLSPVVTLVSVLIGSRLFGLLGSIIAVPVAATISALLIVYFENKGIEVHELETLPDDFDEDGD